MNPTVEIRFAGMQPSQALEHTIREHADKLSRFHPDPMTLHVVLSQPHHHHQRGNVFHVTLAARVKGLELVVNHGDDPPQVHSDPLLALNDAFHTMRRKLTQHARVRRQNVSSHLAMTVATVSQLSPEEGTGVLTTQDDRDLPFNRLAVTGSGFDELHLGSVVHFEEGSPEASPWARLVTPIEFPPEERLGA